MTRTLQKALSATITRRGVSLEAWTREQRWSRSLYVSVARWLRGTPDPRTGRTFPLPLGMRLAIAAAIGFEGPVMTPAEVRRLAPSSSGSSSQGREDKRRRGTPLTHRGNKKEKKAPTKPTKRT